MRIIHVDGGAFVEPPAYKFHDAYFSVVDENGLIHFEKNCGDIYSGEAEYLAIKWAVENIPERPITILSDCETAIAWARHFTKKSKIRGLSPLDLNGIILEYSHGNLADIWNAENHSPKRDKTFYYNKWKNKQEEREEEREEEHLQSIQEE